MQKAPVLYLFFNRPKLMPASFAAIRAYQPEHLFLVCDGPRTTNPEDNALIQQAREIVESLIDWPCKIYRNYADTNLGCKHRVASGVDWFFDSVDRGIILEDDCVADPSFFTFAEKMLDRYETDSRIMSVTGTRFPCPAGDPDAAWFFVNHPVIWGWATWRRAWKLYDVEIQDWGDPEVRRQIESHCRTRVESYKMAYGFNEVHSKQFDTWDYQWHFTHRLNGGLCVVPKENLVQNFGFGADSTHTRDDTSLSFPLETWRDGKGPKTHLADLVFSKNWVEQFLGGNQVARFHHWRERVKQTLRLWTKRDYPL